MTARPRSEEKAQLILAAAQRVLAQKGYASTTISQVAAEAGVSRGLLHYYFKNKEEMLARVVEASLEPALALLGPLLANSPSGKRMAADLAAAMRVMIQGDPAAFTLTFEGWAVARQSDVVARELDSMFRRFRSVVAAGLVQARAQGAIAPKMDIDRLAMMLTGLMDGLALQLVLDDELAADDRVWASLEQAIASLLGAVG